MCVTAPLGQWRTGSIDSLLSAAFSWSMAIATVALVSVPRKLLTVQRFLAFASLTGAILGRFYGADRGGRLILFQGSFSDPNEYAMTLLMGLPYWIMIAKTTQNKVGKTLAYLCMVPILITFLYTGSRGGMIALLVLAVIGLLQMSFPQKLAFCAAGGILFLVSGVFLPNYIQQRFFTFFKADTDTTLDAKYQEQLSGGDIGSSEARWQVLLGGIELTLKHPVFGVGPGNFAGAFYNHSKAQGKNGGWTVSHNSYTEVSSEMGIPGFVLFAAMLYYSFRVTRRVLGIKPTAEYQPPPELVHAGRYLELSLLVVCSGAVFLSMAYHPVFYVAVAMAATLDRLLREDMKQWRQYRQAQPVAQPKVLPNIMPAARLPRLGSAMRRS
ncbi:MAG: O-antigen ligase family protein [Nitrospirota bacterium]